METRAAVCEYDAKRDHLTLTIGSQGSHRQRDILRQDILKMPEKNQVRVIWPDVGGGFGTKIFFYREYALVAVAANKLEQDRSSGPPTAPITSWATRKGRDNLTTATHGAGRGRQVPRAWMST